MLALAFVFVVGVATSAAAQEPAAPSAAPVVTHELSLRDGSRLFGTVDREDEREVVFRSASGSVIVVARDQIRHLRKVRGSMTDGQFQVEDPNQTRLFFGPTGRALPKGQATFGVYEFLMPFVQVGVTDRFSIGGGTPLLFGFDEGDRPFWITPKLLVLDNEQTKVSVGSLIMIAGGDGFHITYAVLTQERGRGSFSAGAGFAGNDDGGFGVVMLGGEGTLTRSLRVISENYVSEHGVILSGGIRFVGERLSADVGLVFPPALDGVVLPIVNFTYAFGR